jgi:predicted enzyme related to lactoylglutathione lyase
MSTNHGKFVWYELMTTDLAAAEDFYAKVVGWTPKDAGAPGMAYTLMLAGETQVAGVMTLPKDASDAGAAPFWIGYVAVDDVDAYAQKVVAAGGALHKPAEDIPGVGRFAGVADPHGASFVIFKGMEGMTPPPAMPESPGYVGWRELMAGDMETDFAFYSGLFGWAKGETMQSPDGPYQMFEIEGVAAGGMMTKPDQLLRPAWNYYITVAGIDAAVERLTQAGGRVVHGPMEVPQDMWIVQALDPQGALFSLLGPQT